MPLSRLVHVELKIHPSQDLYGIDAAFDNLVVVLDELKLQTPAIPVRTNQVIGEAGWGVHPGDRPIEGLPQVKVQLLHHLLHGKGKILDNVGLVPAAGHG